MVGKIECVFLTTPQLENKLFHTQQQHWRQCGQENASHSHIFWQCTKIQTYWEQVVGVLEDIPWLQDSQGPLHSIPGFVKSYVIQSEGIDLLKILIIAARKANTRKWVNSDSPSPT